MSSSRTEWRQEARDFCSTKAFDVENTEAKQQDRLSTLRGMAQACRQNGIHPPTLELSTVMGSGASLKQGK
eukprot:9224984-Karenia_brevis.AAC.1